MIITYNIFETDKKSNGCFEYNVHAFPTEKDEVIGSPFKISLALRPVKELNLDKENIKIISWKLKNLRDGSSIHIDPERLDITKNNIRKTVSVNGYYIDMEHTDHVIEIELDASFCNPSKNNLSLELKFVHKKEKITFWDIMMGI